MNIPYERQIYERSCGAAALTMVYKSLDVDCDQEQIWNKIKRPDSKNSLFTKSCCICKHALKQGFSSIIIKAKDDRIWNISELCDINSIRAIFNHRLNLKSTLGHYTVFVKIVDDGQIEIHDPQYGEHQIRRRAILAELWQPRSSKEITGNILIAISRKKSDKTRCEICGSNIPESIDCLSCNRKVFLQPREVIGCIEKNCIGRNWNDVICPYCNNSIFEHNPSALDKLC